MVKCKDCGFLSLKTDSMVNQQGLLPGTLVEANLEYRDTGQHVLSSLFSNEPVCFVQSYHLAPEIEHYQQSSGWPIANRPATRSQGANRRINILSPAQSRDHRRG